LPGRLGVNNESVIHMASTFAHLTGILHGVRLPTLPSTASGKIQKDRLREGLAGAS
jgi:cyclohexanecarboxylate-CoA ligase